MSWWEQEAPYAYRRPLVGLGCLKFLRRHYYCVSGALQIHRGISPSALQIHISNQQEEECEKECLNPLKVSQSEIN
jgi:hypothetical protein